MYSINTRTYIHISIYREIIFWTTYIHVYSMYQIIQRLRWGRGCWHGWPWPAVLAWTLLSCIKNVCCGLNIVVCLSETVFAHEHVSYFGSSGCPLQSKQGAYVKTICVCFQYPGIHNSLPFIRPTSCLSYVYLMASCICRECAIMEA